MNIKYQFRSNGDDTCKLMSISDFEGETLVVPAYSDEHEKVTSIDLEALKLNSLKKLCLPETFSKCTAYFCKRARNLEELDISSANPFFKVHDGILYSKDMTTLISCPLGKQGDALIPSCVKTVRADAFCECDKLDWIEFQDGLETIENGAFYLCGAVLTLPDSVNDIDRCAFTGEWSFVKPVIRATRNSFVHRFALKHELTYMPSDCPETWDANTWLACFTRRNADYRDLRRAVWLNTLAIVKSGGYTLPNRYSLLLPKSPGETSSVFYEKPFRTSFAPLNAPPVISVIPDDCLDTAHRWVDEGLEVCVLNMASRRNPGGSVRNGAGAQEEYLFRCSDYYRALYPFTSYAAEYDLKRSAYQYPLDRNFGGIFSCNITVFRGNESLGYPLLEKPWQVNMVAVAGMNSPELVYENGERRIAPFLIEGVKNKIRTIFRIAAQNGQRNLVLGALGCGAFRNPPKHVAELFLAVLREPEFSGAFQRICFAIKSDHNSHGDSNYEAFKAILDGYIVENNAEHSSVDINEIVIKKIAIARDSYAILYTDGKVVMFDCRSGKTTRLRALDGSVDLKAGFDAYYGLKENGTVSVDGICRNDSFARRGFLFSDWHDGKVIDACECHFAVVRNDGTVTCAEGHGYDVTNYREIIEKWKDIKQLALTFERPYGLTEQGEFMCEDRDEYIRDFFNSESGAEIVQIAAFGCYYSTHIVAALYQDGSVKAKILWAEEIEEVKKWREVKKIRCGIAGAIGGLTKQNKLLIDADRPYIDDSGNEVSELDNIYDFEMGFFYVVAVENSGRLIILKQKR